jgi:hypothetical protein
METLGDEDISKTIILGDEDISKTIIHHTCHTTASHYILSTKNWTYMKILAIHLNTQT